MKILITGDFVIQNKSALIDIENEKELNEVFHEIRELTSTCDYAITNLENPVTDASQKILKDGPHLKMAPKYMKLISFCGFNIVTLANNHLKDYGNKGVCDTIGYCKTNNLQTVGAGVDISTAYKPLIVGSDDLKIGIINVCESESSIADDAEAGAAPFDLIRIYNAIKEIRNRCQYILLIVHGGCENYSLPTPEMKRKYHFIADIGADVIVNHHQHCLSGYEIYNNVPIFYGLGNMFFDEPNNLEKWYQGLALVLNFNEKIEFQILPFIQCKDRPEIHFDDSNISEIIEGLNAVIADDEQLKKEFRRFVSSSLALSPFTPYNGHYIKALYHRRLLPSFISRTKAVVLQNRILCASHCEVVLEKFRQLISGK